jgi:hypothetical protein
MTPNFLIFYLLQLKEKMNIPTRTVANRFCRQGSAKIGKVLIGCQGNIRKRFGCLLGVGRCLVFRSALSVERIGKEQKDWMIRRIVKGKEKGSGTYADQQTGESGRQERRDSNLRSSDPKVGVI